jgi:hypothetical protein
MATGKEIKREWRQEKRGKGRRSSGEGMATGKEMKREWRQEKRGKGRRSRGLRIPGPRCSVPFLLLETQNPRSFPLFIVQVLPVQVIDPHIAIAAQISA